MPTTNRERIRKGLDETKAGLIPFVERELKAKVSGFTGKDEYEFGDISRKLGQMMFGNKDVKKKNE